MDSDKLISKISRVFSSFASCRFRADVIADNHSNNHNIIVSREKDSPAVMKKPENPVENDGSSGSIGKKEAGPINVHNRSSSSHSALFSSTDEKLPPENDAFPSFSSCSGDSFRRRPGGKKCDETLMKSIDELGEREKNITAPSDGVITGSSRRAPPPRAKTHEENDHDPGCDQMSSRIYYSGRRESSARRRGRRKRRFGGGDAAVGECLAVEKKSRDPRGDFMESMVEMIVTEQLFGAAELERLLCCFLSLNSVCYHSMILEVFAEICETFFT